ncbi:ferritin-like metal-binding protein YciE [Rhodopseudomonas julia]|uniref:Ferritin-like metal-binding protein YciE n=1 Tax=Rhodopseudomonas julia TaxID=200617 RepID=A0ABU0C7U8_9BRAD|nr:ferritin-like domain-containing protein [Rhodopseudomonas julia]MDQ0326560.1 ferritin-like metal-binding protein YciE [Rhodopseudomonas julia]
MAIQNLQELFVHTLKDIYFAEKQILEALPKMADKATNKDLKNLFETHLEETKGHVDRLEAVFGLVGVKPEGETCQAIQGIITEAEELMSEISDGETRDAAMAAAAQAVEHYEIARYGTLESWAHLLGHKEAAKRLGETLEEEKSADAKLSKVGESELNKKAA